MSLLIRTFDTFADAARFASAASQRQRVELRLMRFEGQWNVTSDVAIDADTSHDGGLIQRKEAEISELRQRLAGLQEQLTELEDQHRQVLDEKERFRRRVIEHEAKPRTTVVDEFSQSQLRKPAREPTCEACGAPLTCCRCSG